MSLPYYQEYSLKDMRYSFPNLMKVMKYLREDNCLHMRTSYTISGRFVIRLGKYEAKLRVMKNSELQTMGCGEHTEQEMLVKKYRLSRFDEFLYQVFDGKFRELFFSYGKPESSCMKW